MLVRHSATYLFANSITALIGLASVYVFTRLLDPVVYGSIVASMTLGTILSTLLFSWLRPPEPRQDRSPASQRIRRPPGRC